MEEGNLSLNFTPQYLLRNPLVHKTNVPQVTFPAALVVVATACPMQSLSRSSRLHVMVKKRTSRHLIAPDGEKQAKAGVAIGQGRGKIQTAADAAAVAATSLTGAVHVLSAPQ